MFPILLVAGVSSLWIFVAPAALVLILQRHRSGQAHNLRIYIPGNSRLICGVFDTIQEIGILDIEYKWKVLKLIPCWKRLMNINQNSAIVHLLQLSPSKKVWVDRDNENSQWQTSSDWEQLKRKQFWLLSHFWKVEKRDEFPLLRKTLLASGCLKTAQNRFC